MLFSYFFRNYRAIQKNKTFYDLKFSLAIYFVYYDLFCVDKYLF